MNIPEVVSYDKDGHIERFPLFKKLFLSLIIILTALLSFGVGRLSVIGNREPIRVEYDASISNSQFPISNQASISNALNNIENSKLKIENSTSVVASKNSSKYHYPYCAGAKQIKEENKIVFATPEAAEASGFTLATNCSPR